MEYLIGGAVGGIVMYFIMLFCFKCYIEKQSKENKSVVAFGKRYFFMTQDQIQKAVKAVVLLEKSAEIQPTNFYKNALSIPEERRTAFEKWKASSPENTWWPWWLDEKTMQSMPEVCVHEYEIEQPKTQRKAFEAGFKSCLNQKLKKGCQ